MLLHHKVTRSISSGFPDNTHLYSWAQLFKGSIKIQRLNCYPVDKYCTINQIEIYMYPVDSVVHPSNSWGLDEESHYESKVFCPKRQNIDQTCIFHK